MGGTWSVTFTDIPTLTAGPLRVVASITVAGTTYSAQQSITYSPLVGSLSLNSPIAGDDVINNAERSAVVLSGTSSVSSDVVVTVTDNFGNTLTRSVTVQPDGTWSAILDTSSLLDGPLTVTVSDIDASGNTQSTSRTARLSTALPPLTIDASTLPGGVASSSTVRSIPVSGTTTPGLVVTVTLSDSDNSVQAQATADSNGFWSTTLDGSSLRDGPITVSASVRDADGNISSALSSISLDRSGPVVNINSPISGDGRVSAAEVSSVIISGTTEAGASVQVVVSDGILSDTITVVADGSGIWTTTFDFTNFRDGTTVTATGTDSLGNTGSPANQNVTLATDVTVITINRPIAGDNIVNGLEDDALVISGVAQAGMLVTVTISDGTREITNTGVAGTNGIFSVTLNVSGLGEGTLTVTVSGTNSSGNPSQSSTTVTHDALPPAVTINGPVAGDDIVTSAEASALVISGTGEAG